MPSNITEQESRPSAEAPQGGKFNPTRKALLNSVTNFARGILSIGVTVVLTPILVSHLGPVDFGVWSLFGLFITYIALVDLGISGATAKLLGELQPGGDSGRASEIFTSALTMAGAVSISAILLGFGFRQELSRGLGTFGLHGERATVFLVGALALFSSGLVSNCALYVLFGLHRLDIANYIAACVLLIQAIAMLATLESGFGLQCLLVVATGSSIISIVAYLIAKQKVAPEVKFSFTALRKTTVSQILSFGLFLQAYALMGVFYFYAGKAIVGMQFSLTAVASYEVAIRLPILLRQGSLTIVGPMMPAVSHLDANGRDQEIRLLLSRTLRYFILVGVPLFLALVIFAEPIVRLWVGSGFADSVLPLRLLSVGLGLSVVPDTVWFFLVGIGQHRPATVLALAHAFAGVAICYGLAFRWGLAGVALGVLIIALSATVLYLGLVVRKKILRVHDVPVGFACKIIAIAGVTFGIAFLVGREAPWTYFRLSAAVLLASLGYMLLIMRAGVLDDQERAVLRRFLPAALHNHC